MISRLPSEAIRRLAGVRRSGAEPADPGGGSAPAPRAVLDVEQATEQVIARWGADLCGLLNAMTRGELEELAARLGVSRVSLAPAAAASAGPAPAAGRAPVLRVTLWDHGAALERGAAEVSPAVQPRPIVLGGHLVIQAVPRGLFPASARWPRPVPPPRAAAPPDGEPDALDELLAAADRAIGVRLGARGKDKGAWGIRAARLLGLVERSEREPDWRGDVEVKTVAIARDPGGWWRVVEDPAIAMVGEPALAKLARTLWLARCDVGGGGAGPRDATIVSWYLLDWDPDIARLTRRDLHDRPKGPAGGAGRGHYLHRRFFADAGLLASLNGSGHGAAPGKAEPA